MSALPTLSKNNPDPDFCDELMVLLRRDLLAHFNRLPYRYSMNMNNRAEDILLHKSFLELAKFAVQLPIIDVKLVQANEEIKETGHPMTQITVAATENKPKLFNKVLNAFVLKRLNIKETYAYRTNDGYVLGVFILSRHEYEAERLKKDLQEELCKFEISEGTELPQKSSIVCFLRLSWTCVRWLLYVVVSLAALYFLIGGVRLMYGASREEADVFRFAAPVGELLIDNVTKIADTDIGASLVFVAAPLLGIVTVLFMLLEAIGTSMVMKAKVPIVSWLTVSLFLGVALPFTRVRVAAIKDKASSVFSSLVTVLAALTNFHRKDD